MKPKPLSVVKNFTVPIGMSVSFHETCFPLDNVSNRSQEAWKGRTVLVASISADGDVVGIILKVCRENANCGSPARIGRPSEPADGKPLVWDASASLARPPPIDATDCAT